MARKQAALPGMERESFGCLLLHWRVEVLP